jgi:hypothetical protein
MRSICLLAIPLTAGWILAGCSNGSGLPASYETTSKAGGSGQSSARGGGGASQSNAAGAGTPASGGKASWTFSTSGGSPLVTSASVGERAGSVGGSWTSAVGGRTKTGGSSATAGASTATGGRSMMSSATIGGNASAGAGGASTPAGGSSRGGTNASGGSTSTGRNPDAGAGDGGIVASGYCEGSAAKLTYQGQTVTPGVTDYQSNIVMDCCDVYGVNLHSTASLGFDVAIELILSLSIFTPGEYDLGGSTSIRARAVVFKSNDPSSSVSTVNSQGRLRVFGADGSVGLTELGICLEVTEAASVLAGTKLYVPRVIIGSYQSDKRFQIFLLKDSTLRAGAVSSQPLDSLVLADSPFLDLGRIAYVEKATTKMGFNPGQKVGDSLRTRLGTPLDLPFVAVADGVRVYLGSFTSPISSIAPTGPYVYVEEITADGLTLRAPARGTDPRNDERIIKALSERGKLVP